MISLRISLSLLLIWCSLSQGYASTNSNSNSNINTMTQYKRWSLPIPIPRMENSRLAFPEQKSREEESRTFNFNSGADDEENDDEGGKNKWGISSDDLDWGTTSLVYWPPVLLVLGLLAIPTTLVILVVFIIPIITPQRDEKTKRSLNNGQSGYGYGYGYGFTSWTPIATQLAREIIFDSSKQEKCIERISCELMTTANSYTFPLEMVAFALGRSENNSSASSSYTPPLTNWIQKKITESSILSDRLKMRISRSIQYSMKDSSKISCQKYMCKPLERNNENLSNTSSKNNANEQIERTREQKRRKRRHRRFTALPEFEPNDTIWDKLVKYFGNRWLFVRKLQENKDVTFYPYLPSIG